MRVAALAGDRVDPLDVLGPEVVEDLADEPDAFVLTHARPHLPIQLVVGGVDHHACRLEQQDLVLGFDHAGALHQLLAVDDLDPGALEREHHSRLDDVDADRRAQQPAGLERAANFLRDVLCAAALR